MKGSNGIVWVGALAFVLFAGVTSLWGDGPKATMVESQAGTTGPSENDLSKGGLNVDFYENDIRQVLLGIAMDRNVNIVMSPEVTGKITVHLSNVTVERAIASISGAGGYECRKDKGVYFINKAKSQFDSQSDRLQIKVFKLKFAKIDKVQEILTALPGIRTVKIHDDTKTIIVEDVPENIAKVQEVIEAWDTPPKQVLIEAQILEITLNDQMALGVDWTKIMGGFSATTGTNFTSPATGGVLTTFKTAVGTAHEFTAAIAALQTITNVNTLSTPKILTIDGRPARVQVGGKTGYSTTITNLGVTTQQIQFIDTGTLLDISAVIGDKDNILLTVQPQITSAIVPASGIPSVTTTNVSTTLLTKSGQTVFIGGLIRESVQNTRETIPFLGKIPLVGSLFGYTNPEIDKTELVVLITPYILTEDIQKTTNEARGEVDKRNEKYAKDPPTVYKGLTEGGN